MLELTIKHFFYERVSFRFRISDHYCLFFCLKINKNPKVYHNIHNKGVIMLIEKL